MALPHFKRANRSKAATTVAEAESEFRAKKIKVKEESDVSAGVAGSQPGATSGADEEDSDQKSSSAAADMDVDTDTALEVKEEIPLLGRGKFQLLGKHYFKQNHAKVCDCCALLCSYRCCSVLTHAPVHTHCSGSVHCPTSQPIQ